MACIYNDNVELTYSYGGHLGNKDEHIYYEDTIQISRCCLLKPEKYISFDDFMNLPDIVQYIKEIPFVDKVRTPAVPKHPMCEENKCQLLGNEKIRTVIVGLSFACNLNCYHCWYAGRHKDTPAKKALYFHTLYGLKEHNLDTIVLTNKGEPFFYLEETIDYLKTLTIKDVHNINAVTNGNCLTIESINEMAIINKTQGIKFNFLFSIDAITEETYLKTRIGGDFSLVLKNLEACIKAFGKDFVTVSFTCKMTNIHEVTKAEKFFKAKFGVKTQISFDSYEPDIRLRIESINN